MTSARNAIPPTTPPTIGPTGVELLLDSGCGSDVFVDVGDAVGDVVGDVVDAVELEERLAIDKAGKISLTVYFQHFEFTYLIP